MSEAQQLLDAGKYVIVTFEGYWHVITPPGCKWSALLGDHVRGSRFTEDVPEEEVRDFYVKRLGVEPDDVRRVLAAE